MKKTIYTLLLSGTFILTGCDQFLEVQPDSEYSVDAAYKTQNDFNQAIAGTYAVQQGLFASNTSWFRGTLGRGDEVSLGSNYFEGLDQFTDNASNSWTTQSWNDHFKIIHYSNLILDKIDAGEFSDSKMRDNIKGEAYMFRAYAYWTLGWIFGGVPILEKPLSVAEVKKVKRSSQEQTFAYAETNYKEAIKLLPAEWTGANRGRITKYAAEGMLARLYMSQSKFSMAKPLLADIIGSGKYSLEDSYKKAFDDGFDNGKERVWEVQFVGGQTGEGQNFATGLLPEGFNDKSVMPFSGYSSFLKVAPGMYDSYEKGDLRKGMSTLKGWVSATGVVDTVTVFIRKYNHYTYVPKSQQDWANNIPVLRYADVKMMYAEVLNEEGYVAEGESLAILNEIRSRAGLPAKMAKDITTQQAMREAIRKERRVEFAFEGLRWLDLLRWNIAEETVNKFLATKLEGGGIYSMKAHQKVFAVPFEEISRYADETMLWQNPGY
ncbi:RagB/SusD family nutrient uptake outer membrane protein [Dyadobacter bucti]|uniref:RagB/SusD family nutrient uptake outer membrane protein n=1 Tax=Dyadobacter bucti TaxID=2572203 RepID=UPI003F724767